MNEDHPRPTPTECRPNRRIRPYAPYGSDKRLQKVAHPVVRRKWPPLRAPDYGSTRVKSILLSRVLTDVRSPGSKMEYQARMRLLRLVATTPARTIIRASLA